MVLRQQVRTLSSRHGGGSEGRKGVRGGFSSGGEVDFSGDDGRWCIRRGRGSVTVAGGWQRLEVPVLASASHHPRTTAALSVQIWIDGTPAATPPGPRVTPVGTPAACSPPKGLLHGSLSVDAPIATRRDNIGPRGNVADPTASRFLGAGDSWARRVQIWWCRRLCEATQRRLLLWRQRGRITIYSGDSVGDHCYALDPAGRGRGEPESTVTPRGAQI